MFLPTLQQAQEIVRRNDAFETSIFEIEGRRVHHFGYLLPGYMDFEDPVPGSGLQGHELRGLTFVEEPDGSVSRYLMLRKFHALDQTTGHMLKDVANKQVVSCTEKLDGSLVRFIPVGGRLLARTKASFFGPHAELANDLLAADPALAAFVADAHAAGLAPIFELTSPAWRIVVPYEQECLRLIQMRDETDGSYVDDLAAHPLVGFHNVATAAVLGVRTVEDLLEARRTAKGIEGWVLRFEDGQTMKLKTVWYDDFHDFFFEQNRSSKKMVSMVLNGTMDDALAAMGPDDPARPAAEDADRLVSAYVNGIVRHVCAAIDVYPSHLGEPDARKAFAASLKGDPLIGLVMQALKDPSPREVFALARRHVAGQAKREEDASRLLDRLRAAHASEAPAFRP